MIACWLGCLVIIVGYTTWFNKDCEPTYTAIGIPINQLL
jgi:hypothetical protein